MVDASPARRIPIRFDPWYRWLSSALGLAPSRSYVEVEAGEIEVRMGWAFRSRFPRASNSVVHRALRLAERMSIGLARAAVTVNPAMRDRLIGLGVAPDKVGVVANSPSLARFDPTTLPRRAFAEDGVVRLVYAGALTPTYEIDVAIDAVAELAAARPELNVAFDVYGRGDAADPLADRARDRGVADRVVFHGRIPIEDVPAMFDAIRRLAVRGAPAIGIAAAFGVLLGVQRGEALAPEQLVALAEGCARRLGEAPAILTPHPGEFRGLFPDLAAQRELDPWGAAEAAAERTRAVVLLKGVPTAVAVSGRPALTVAAGNPGLATGGSGDVLSGIIGTALAQELEPRIAAALGAQALGRAADIAVRRVSARSLRPTDVVAAMGDLWREWEMLRRSPPPPARCACRARRASRTGSCCSRGSPPERPTSTTCSTRTTRATCSTRCARSAAASSRRTTACCASPGSAAGSPFATHDSFSATPAPRCGR